jgi:hypothetical protein
MCGLLRLRDGSISLWPRFLISPKTVRHIQCNKNVMETNVWSIFFLQSIILARPPQNGHGFNSFILHSPFVIFGCSVGKNLFSSKRHLYALFPIFLKSACRAL